MRFTVGLTGGIGSGKSTVAHIFSSLGVPVIDADVLARTLIEPGKPAFHAIVKRYGSVVKQKDGSLNRTFLRQKIFNHPEQKQWLEDLLHPEIYQLIAQATSLPADPYVLVVIPLLAEHYMLYRSILDHTIVVDATSTQQLTRASARDGLDSAFIKKIIENQASRLTRLGIADTVLINEGSLSTLRDKIISLHKSFLANFKP